MKIVISEKDHGEADLYIAEDGQLHYPFGEMWSPEMMIWVQGPHVTPSQLAILMIMAKLFELHLEIVRV